MINVPNGFTMESDESERQKKLEAGKEKVVIEPRDVALRAKFRNYFDWFCIELVIAFGLSILYFNTFPAQNVSEEEVGDRHEEKKEERDIFHKRIWAKPFTRG